MKRCINDDLYYGCYSVQWSVVRNSSAFFSNVARVAIKIANDTKRPPDKQRKITTFPQL